MTTRQMSQAERSVELAAERMEAEVREAEARLKLLKAQAEAREAQADMHEISGLTAAKERVQQEIAALKQQAVTDYSIARQTVQQHIEELQASVQRVHDRYTAFDDARERRFNARLDEAEARLKVWKAEADKGRAQDKATVRSDLARLEEKVTQARAQMALAGKVQTARARAALEEAERRFDEAYSAAAARLGKPPA